jgi:guanyl-specific ribonuclease Sa
MAQRSLRVGPWLVVLVAAIVAAALWRQPGDTHPSAESAATGALHESPTDLHARGLQTTSDHLPIEAQTTLDLIATGGPFSYDRDGTVFQNRERRLPDRPRGYYREYTVPTPGERDRGARRIVAGGDPPEVYYYTDDHYETFRRLEGVNGHR